MVEMKGHVDRIYLSVIGNVRFVKRVRWRVHKMSTMVVNC